MLHQLPSHILTHSIRIIDDYQAYVSCVFTGSVKSLTFTQSSTSTCRPVTSVEEGVPLVTSLELDLHAELVLVCRDRVCHSRVIESFEHLLRACAPTLMPRCDVSRGVVVGLQEVAGIAVGGKVFDDELFVLSSRLNNVRKA